MQVTFYGVCMLFAALMMAVLAGLLWPRRDAPAVRPMLGLTAAMLIWTVNGALESMATSLDAKIVFSVLSYPGATTAPVFFLLFCIEFTQNTWWSRGRRTALFAIPTLVCLGAITNTVHGQLWTTFTWAPQNTIIYGHGPLFWLVTIYSYVIILIGLGMLAMAVGRYKGAHRRQATTLLAFSLVPVLGSLSYVTNLSPFPHLDPAPLFFCVTAAGLAWSILRQGLFRSIPVSADAVLETITDGVLVLDTEDHVVIANATLRRWLGMPQDVTGVPVTYLLDGWPDVLHLLEGSRDAGEVVLAGLAGITVDPRVTVLSDRSGRPAGRILVLQDVSERRSAQLALSEANSTLSAQLATIEALQDGLREQAIRDPLTGLYNRRYLDETLTRELARARRDSDPVSLVMLDVDNFKSLNDTEGHEAGDRVLKVLADLIHGTVREGDIACRYGGDEYLVVLPGSTTTAASERVEEWILALTPHLIWGPAGGPAPTISAGIATFPENADDAGELVRQADLALYAAKGLGRDRVETSTHRVVPEPLPEPVGVSGSVPAASTRP